MSELVGTLAAIREREAPVIEAEQAIRRDVEVLLKHLRDLAEVRASVAAEAIERTSDAEALYVTNVSLRSIDQALSRVREYAIGAIRPTLRLAVAERAHDGKGST